MLELNAQNTHAGMYVAFNLSVSHRLWTSFDSAYGEELPPPKYVKHFKVDEREN